MSERWWDLPGVDVCWAATKIGAEQILGHRESAPVTPASVMKVQVALAASLAMESGRIDGRHRVRLDQRTRTPGPVGLSLMDDPAELSLRDLQVLMMTISDNVATDAVIRAVGLPEINDLTRRLGLTNTRVTDDLQSMLDGMAVDVGFEDYAALVAHDPATAGPPNHAELTARIVHSAALDPARGSRTTAADMVRLLSRIWTDEVGSAAAAARVRRLMRNQLTRHRIASGFGPGVQIAAKSGGLMGIVRHEVGVVTEPDAGSYAIAIFTRREPGSPTEPKDIDAAIGRLAARLVEQAAALE
ncbi:MAG TPA: serine hydrolase [Microlunatus sp.]